MDPVTVTLVLLVAVAVSGIVARLLPVPVPLPIVQIASGAALSSLAGFEVSLDPALFFVLLIPPLLFLDGWRIPKGAFFRDWRPILTLALGLVVFTVLGLGLLIGQMIPAVPLAVAFAIAAIVSPTDPVAVSAISGRAPMPARLMHILEGEALLNDASGLVCFRFAVAAALTGSFSLTQASLSFAGSVAGGLLAGIAVAAGASAAYRLLSRRTGEEQPGTHILISLLVPFAAYLAAESLHASGILAAAVAGMSMHYADLISRLPAVTRMRRAAVWDMAQATLNGVVFVLLGEQLPGLLARAPAIARDSGLGSAWWLLAYAAAITAGLALLRFAWIAGSLALTRLLNRGSPARERPSLRVLLVAALAGVRGAVTLAGILTLPLATPDGSPFPARDLAIVLATGVILLSLAVASLCLPVLARGLELPDPLPRADEEATARNAAAEAALRSIEAAVEPGRPQDSEIGAEAARRIAELYHRRLDRERGETDEAERARRLAAAERRLRVRALQAERDELYRLRLSRKIDDDLHRRLVREIDLLEAGLSASP